MKKIVLIILIFSIHYAFSQGYTIKKFVFGSSAQTAISNDYIFKNTVGQPLIGKYQNNDNTLYSGFWGPAPGTSNIISYTVTGGGYYCQGGNGVAIGLSGSQEGVYYQLKKDGNNIGNPLEGTGQALNFGIFTEAGTYTVLAYTEEEQKLMIGNAIVGIYQLPTASISGSKVICVGDNAQLNVQLTGTPPFTITFNDNFTATNVQNTTYTRIVTPNQSFTYTITNVSDAHCNNVGTGEAVITVNLLPNVTLGNFAPVCGGSSAFPLYGGQPQGGWYAGTHVDEWGNFHPVEPGTFNITYFYEDPQTHCTNFATNQIVVNELPDVSLQLPYNEVCYNSQPFLLTGGLPEGGWYEINGQTVQYFNPANYPWNEYVNIEYFYMDANGCINSANGNILVRGPSFDISVISPQCPAPGWYLQLEIYVNNCPFNNGNKFSVYISDANGNFNPGTLLAELESTTSIIYGIQIPQVTPSNNYKLKVVPSNPALQGKISNSFTIINAPTATTGNATNITGTTVNISGNIQSTSAVVQDKGVEVTQFTNQLGTLYSAGAGTGNFNLFITGLQTNTLYYYRTYALYCGGYVYGTWNQFQTEAVPQVVITGGENRVTCREVSIQLAPNVQVSGGSGEFTYSWSPTIYLNNPNLLNPTVINPLISTNYTLTVHDVQTNQNTTLQVLLTVIQNPTINIPSLINVPRGTTNVNLCNFIISPTCNTPGFILDWRNAQNVPINPLNAPLTGTLTTFKVYVTNQYGCQSNKIFKVYRPTAKEASFEDLISENETFVLIVYPTPTEDVLNYIIALDESKDIQISIYDLLGQNVVKIEKFAMDYVEDKLDLSKLPAGIYYMIVQTGNDRAIRKIMKN